MSTEQPTDSPNKRETIATNNTWKGDEIDKKSLAEHNRLSQIASLLNREQPGKRSRATLKEIASMMLEFDSIVRYV